MNRPTPTVGSLKLPTLLLSLGLAACGGDEAPARPDSGADASLDTLADSGTDVGADIGVDVDNDADAGREDIGDAEDADTDSGSDATGDADTDVDASTDASDVADAPDVPTAEPRCVFTSISPETFAVGEFPELTLELACAPSADKSLKTSFAVLLNGASGSSDGCDDEAAELVTCTYSWDFAVTEEMVGRIEIRVIPDDGTGPIVTSVGASYSLDAIEAAGGPGIGELVPPDLRGDFAIDAFFVGEAEAGTYATFLTSGGQVFTRFVDADGNFARASDPGRTSSVGSYGVDDVQVWVLRESGEAGSGGIGAAGILTEARGNSLMVDFVPIVDGEVQDSTQLPTTTTEPFTPNRLFAGTPYQPRGTEAGDPPGVALLLSGASATGSPDDLYLALLDGVSMELIPVTLPADGLGVVAGTGRAVFSSATPSVDGSLPSFEELELWVYYESARLAGGEIIALSLGRDGSTGTLSRFPVPSPSDGATLHDRFGVAPVAATEGYAKLIALESDGELPTLFFSRADGVGVLYDQQEALQFPPIVHGAVRASVFGPPLGPDAQVGLVAVGFETAPEVSLEVTFRAEFLGEPPVSGAFPVAWTIPSSSEEIRPGVGTAPWVLPVAAPLDAATTAYGTSNTGSRWEAVRGSDQDPYFLTEQTDLGCTECLRPFNEVLVPRPGGEPGGSSVRFGMAMIDGEGLSLATQLDDGDPDPLELRGNPGAVRFIADHDKDSDRLWSMIVVQPPGGEVAVGFFAHDAEGATRRPGVWLYPGSTRLHVRSGTRRSWNEGSGPGKHLLIVADDGTATFGAPDYAAIAALIEDPPSEERPIPLIDPVSTTVAPAHVEGAWLGHTMLPTSWDESVLRGRWDGQYSDGREPTMWTRSSGSACGVELVVGDPGGRVDVISTSDAEDCAGLAVPLLTGRFGIGVGPLVWINGGAGGGGAVAALNIGGGSLSISEGSILTFDDSSLMVAGAIGGGDFNGDALTDLWVPGQGVFLSDGNGRFIYGEEGTRISGLRHMSAPRTPGGGYPARSGEGEIFPPRFMVARTAP